MDRPADRPLTGILWMIVTGLCFVAVTAIVKLMGTRLPAAESAFLRYLIGLAFIIPMLRPLLAHPPERGELRLFAIRGAAHTVGVVLWFYAMARITLAEVTALNYLSPVYVTLGAGLFLGEVLAARRLLAVAAALVGALIILRPGFRELSPGHLSMLGTAVAFGGSYLLGKRLSSSSSPAVVVAMLSITVTIGLAPLAAAVWVTPTLHELTLVFFVALFATAGHYTMTLAFAAAPVSVTQPVTFLQLLWSVLIGAAFFGEAIDGWVVAGGGVILAAVSFITWREEMLKRRVVTPVSVETKV